MLRTLLLSLLSAALVMSTLIVNASAGDTPNGNRFDGKYCSGTGDAARLKLIDESFAFFHADPNVPNLTMLYDSSRNTFEEGAGWGAWWIQNSYGFSYSVTPFLQEPWFSTLQNSWDMFWNNQGDGKRGGRLGEDKKDNILYSMIAPDGCLGDCAVPTAIAYKQGDGDVKTHDWFYDATAAGVVMQAEILLSSRNAKAIAHYLPKMERACDAIERTRDPKNNLFLVGPACNLLAPSYGGVKQADGSFGKGYLAGLSITYLAAVDRMVELYKFTGDKAKLAEYERRQKITRESLPQLLSPAGYFVKSVEQGGLKHGVLGQDKFNYLEGVANVDAVGLRVADDAVSQTIYKQIAAFTEIRPFDFLLTNAPGLDDTYVSYGSPKAPSIFEYGCWVNGGVWGTVEGRAILAYSRLGKFEDIRRSTERAMRWAKEFRMDDHLTQRGENADNLWYDKEPQKRTGVTITIDNFAIPAATIRGLFDYEYRADRLVLRPRLPKSISEFVQKEPIRFGEKKVYISCRNGGMKVKSITIDGKPLNVDSPEAAVLPFDALSASAKVEIVTDGGWGEDNAPSVAPALPAIVKIAAASRADLPASLKKPYAVLKAFEKALTNEPNAEFERAFLRETLNAIEAWRARTTIEPEGCFRPMTVEKRNAIVNFYERAATQMYAGFSKKMLSYAGNPDAGKKHLSDLFQKAMQ